VADSVQPQPVYHVVRKTDGRIVAANRGTPPGRDPATTDVVQSPDYQDDARTFWNGSAWAAAGQALLDAWRDEDTAQNAGFSAADKDLIATIALIESKTNLVWGTLTLPQKVAAVTAAVNSWKTLRSFVEKNL